MELNNKRDLPVMQVKQVIERPIERANGIKSIKIDGNKRSIKAIDPTTAFKTLSGLKRAVVKAHQACQLAEMDLEDMNFNDPSSIQSDTTLSPSMTKSLESIRDASKLIQKASDLVETAKQCMNQPPSDQAVAADPSKVGMSASANPLKKR